MQSTWPAVRSSRHRDDTGRATKELRGLLKPSTRLDMARTDSSVLNACWRKGSWHCLLNRYMSGNQHGIDYHTDDKPPTYNTLMDPVVSYSYGDPCPLYIRHKETPECKSNPVPVLIVHQRSGDALVMGGDFQKKFEHMVPSLHQWLTVGLHTNQGATALCRTPRHSNMANFLESMPFAIRKAYTGHGEEDGLVAFLVVSYLWLCHSTSRD